MKSTALAVTLALSLSGCASTIEAWKGRPWGSHNFRAQKIYVGSADRRISITGERDGSVIICPELSPEVAVSRSAQSTPSLSIKEAQTLSFADAVTALQMKGHELDASSQKYAMLHWTLCTAYLNSTIDKPTYQRELLALVADGRTAMLSQATAAKDVGMASAKAGAAAVPAAAPAAAVPAVGK
ncbi:hypothetical protein [Sphingomonas sp. S-NIH.Pt15_0812]|uniref:hypothetical protein n=1 Tax=Sphingomonas sp. S-NIH.Pt15_0812 TaxID=1920129 RepID=UPI000F7DB197|nr:hypothetical protein [Sphingomonas sp. S-NIH.Pt15_0812]